jgi:hypothetical protein
LNIFVSLGKESSQNRKFTSQTTTKNKIYIASVDLYQKIFLNSNWPKILFQCRTICLKTYGKISAQPNSQIKSYVW